MKAFALKPDLKVELMKVGSMMDSAGLSKKFIADAVETAFDFEGVYDLMKMWEEETDQKDREEIVADIQDLIEDCAQKDNQSRKESFIMDASPVLKCDCDPEVGFFCVHCAMENNYIQDLQNKLIALEAENARYREALELIIKQFPKDYEVRITEIASEALKGME